MHKELSLQQILQMDTSYHQPFSYCTQQWVLRATRLLYDEISCPPIQEN